MKISNVIAVLVLSTLVTTGIMDAAAPSDAVVAVRAGATAPATAAAAGRLAQRGKKAAASTAAKKHSTRTAVATCDTFISRLQADPSDRDALDHLKMHIDVLKVLYSEYSSEQTETSAEASTPAAGATTRHLPQQPKKQTASSGSDDATDFQNAGATIQGHVNRLNTNPRDGVAAARLKSDLVDLLARYCKNCA